MRAGLLRHQITIKRKVVALNTYNEEIVTWTDVASVRAQIETVSGSEFVDVETAAAILVHKITIRRYAGLAPTMRVYWGTRVFEIAAVMADNLNRATVLMCSEAIGD